MNYFILAASAMYALGGTAEILKGNPYIGGTFLCYAVANYLLLSVK